MSAIAAIRHAIEERRIGFRIDETMSGDHAFEPGFGDGARRPMEFRVTWGTDCLGQWLNPRGPDFMRSPLAGRVTVEGLCIDAPCEGTLELRYFTEQKIRYTFTFTVKGERYRYVGEKRDLRPWNLHVSHTTCYGELRRTSDDELVSRSVTHFRLHTIPAFLWSLRLA